MASTCVCGIANWGNRTVSRGVSAARTVAATAPVDSRRRHPPPPSFGALRTSCAWRKTPMACSGVAATSFAVAFAFHAVARATALLMPSSGAFAKTGNSFTPRTCFRKVRVSVGFWGDRFRVF